MDGAQKSILLLAAGGIMFASGRFSEDVGIFILREARGVPLRFLVVFVTFLGLTASVAVLFFPVGGAYPVILFFCVKLKLYPAQ